MRNDEPDGLLNVRLIRLRVSVRYLMIFSPFLQHYMKHINMYNTFIYSSSSALFIMFNIEAGSIFDYIIAC